MSKVFHHFDLHLKFTLPFRLLPTFPFFSPPGSSDDEFASALYHFNHSLVTSDLPSPSLQVNFEIFFKNVFKICDKHIVSDDLLSPMFLQNTLLQQLGVAPFSEGPWPMYIHPQSLSVLSRLLLIWQHKASQQGEPDVPECMKVWER